MSDIDIVRSLDSQIHKLVEWRAALLSSDPVVPPQDSAQLYRVDNMRWHVRPAANAAAIEIALYNPGIGWLSRLMSLGQIEDFVTESHFAGMQIRTILNLSAPHQPELRNGDMLA